MHQIVAVAFVTFVSTLIALPRFAGAACGDGVVDPGEACDFGLDVADDCCAADCSTVFEGSPCSVEGACRAGRCAVPMRIDLVRIAPRRDTHHLGSILVRGRFAPAPPLAVEHGLTVRVQDGTSLDRTVAWTRAECRVRKGALCVTKPNRKAQLSGFSDRYGVKLRLLTFDIDAPFQPPVIVTISHDGGIDRVGSIATCHVSATSVMLCP